MHRLPAPAPGDGDPGKTQRLPAPWKRRRASLRSIRSRRETVGRALYWFQHLSPELGRERFGFRNDGCLFVGIESRRRRGPGRDADSDGREELLLSGR